MLRSMMLASVLITAVPAWAEQFPASAVGLEVRGDDGTVLGRVEQVTRDGQGRIVSARFSGLEAPADAPYPVVQPRAPEMLARAPAQRRLMAENAAQSRPQERQITAR